MAEESKSRLLKEGDRFGDYTVVKLLGKGGMGVVYLMRGASGSEYAVKIMFPDKVSHEMRRRFAKEAEFAIKIRHRNLVSVYDVGEDPETGLCYMIMDYVAGGSLSDMLKVRGRLPLSEAVSIASQVASALEVAHRHGLVHRDIKPDNILFDADGTPRLANLGVAKFDDAQQSMVTTTGMVIGTPAYMAPEQMLNSHTIDARADIYSLGVVLYEMLSGKRPNEGRTAIELMAKAIKGEPLPDIKALCPELSAAFAHVVSLLCAPKPEARPQTALAAADILRKAASGKFVLLRKKPQSSAADAAARKKRIPVGAILSALGIVALCATVVANYLNKSTPRLPPTQKQVMVVTNVVERVAVVTNAVEKAALDLTVVSAVAPPSMPRSLPESRPELQTETAKPQSGVTDQRVRYAKVGSHTWYYTLENGEAMIWRGQKSYNEDTRPAVEPSTDEEIVVPAELGGYKVKAIGNHAFLRCRRLKSIIVPEGIRDIRGGAFLRCDNLKTVRLPTSLKRITSAFQHCQSLETVDISNCTDFSGFSFGWCPRLARITVAENNRAFVEIDGALYTRDRKTLVFSPRTAVSVSVPKFVNKIGNGAFYSSQNLTCVSLPENVIEIGAGAFGYCENLVDVRIAHGLRVVDRHAFDHCTRLKEIAFPASLEKLGVNIFDNCSNLDRVAFAGDAPALDVSRQRSVLGGNVPQRLTIAVKRGSRGWKAPGSVDLPEAWPMKGLEGSRPIRFIDDFKEIGRTAPPSGVSAGATTSKNADNSAENDRHEGIRTAHVNGYDWRYMIETSGNALLTGGGQDICLSPRPVGKVVVPATLDGHKVVAIDHMAFHDCHKMSEIVFPEGLEEIRGWYIFARCHGLTEVTLPKSMRRIGTWAFESCTNLKRVNLMNCERADNGFGCNFIGCYALEEILCSNNNRAISSVNGVLYSKDRKTLLAYPKTKNELKLLHGVTGIANSALVSLPMRHVKIPEGIVFMDGHNFEFDWKGTIETVEFPKSLKVIGDALFKSTKSVKRVMFRGNAPDIPKNGPFVEADADFIVEVPRHSRGWNGPGSTDIPERWPVGAGGDSRRICYIGEVGEQGVDSNQDLAVPASLNVKYEKDSTRAVQKALNAVFPGWKTTTNRSRGKCKYANDIGFVPEKCGRRNLVATIPESEGSPVVLSRTVALTAERHTFTYAVRKYPSGGGGMRIRVLVNGKVVNDESIQRHDGTWHEPEIDLSRWIGQTVKLKVEHYPLNGNAHVANAFWARLEVR